MKMNRIQLIMLSILSKVELPFFYSAIQRMKEEITDGTQELAGIQRWCVAE